MDNFTAQERKRYQLIVQIQALLQDGYSYREIARRLSVGRNTIAKYKKGNSAELSKPPIKATKIDSYHDKIVECLKNGYSKSGTVKLIYSLGYTGAKSTAFAYLVKLVRITGKQFAPQLYVRTQPEVMSIVRVQPERSSII